MEEREDGTTALNLHLFLSCEETNGKRSIDDFPLHHSTFNLPSFPCSLPLHLPSPLKDLFTFSPLPSGVIAGTRLTGEMFPFFFFLFFFANVIPFYLFSINKLLFLLLYLILNFFSSSTFTCFLLR